MLALRTRASIESRTTEEHSTILFGRSITSRCEQAAAVTRKHSGYRGLCRSVGRGIRSYDIFKSLQLKPGPVTGRTTLCPFAKRIQGPWRLVVRDFTGVHRTGSFNADSSDNPASNERDEFCVAVIAHYLIATYDIGNSTRFGPSAWLKAARGSIWINSCHRPYVLHAARGRLIAFSDV